MYIFAQLSSGALAHLARALDWQSKGDRFESDMLHEILTPHAEMCGDFYFIFEENIIMAIQDWFVALSAIATLFMAGVTYLSLRQNKEQLNELKRQWEEQNSPRIVPLIIRKNRYIILRFKNISNVTAHNVFPKVKIKTAPNELEWYFNVEEKINDTRLLIEPNGYKDVIISQYWAEIKYQGNIDVEILYMNRVSEKFNISLTELNIVQAYQDIDAISIELRRISDEIQRKKFM